VIPASEHRLNASDSIRCSRLFPSKPIHSSDVQSEKLSVPMTSTAAGIEIALSNPQHENVFGSIRACNPGQMSLTTKGDTRGNISRRSL
jgi:hypothetical protein